jgi:hypothetical protein
MAGGPTLVVDRGEMTPATVPRPAIAEESGAHWTQYEAIHDPEHASTLTFGCVASPIPGWVEDMRVPVEAPPRPRTASRSASRERSSASTHPTCSRALPSA